MGDRRAESPTAQPQGRRWLGGPGPCGLQGVSRSIGQGPWGFLIPPAGVGGGRGIHGPRLAGMPCDVLSLDCPTFLLVAGGRGVCRGVGGTAQSSLFIWGNVWYVWYLGVYFPGCSWVPGVEICLLHAGGGTPWAWPGLDLEASELLLQIRSTALMP